MEHLLAKLRAFDALRDGEVGNDRVDKAILKAISPTYADEKALWVAVGAVWSEPVSGPDFPVLQGKNREFRGFGLE